MEHFYQNIQGWADGIDMLYKNIISNLVPLDPTADPYHFVEVGSWRGKSSAFMAVEIANSNHRITFDCIDTWQGSLSEESHQQDPSVVNDTLYQEFLDNMKPVENYYRPIRMTSVEAANLYADHSLDFVFIDAAHDYASVKEDIIAWRNKVKRGGVLAGHDYYPVTNVEECGVTKAVRELIPNYIPSPFGWCWVAIM